VDSTVEALKALGGEAFSRQWRAEDEKEAGAAIKEIMDAHGKLDVLVNNAGMAIDGSSLRMSREDFLKTLEINLVSVFTNSRLAARHMLKAGSGRIVNLASAVAFTGNPGQCSYTSAKGGVVSLTRTLALEYASRNVTVNCVAPGYIDTDMTRGIPAKRAEAIISRIPLERPGKPEDVAQAVAFLASEGAGYITGATLHVNGGLYL
jgi:3-oxoacyl-[acyl-carrier protein] reductase